MALQKLLSRLPLKALGSSHAVRRVNASGIWMPLLPSGMLPQAEDFHTLPSSAALNYSLESGIQRGAGHSFYNGTRTAPKSTAKVDILWGDSVKAEIFAEAGRQIEGSLVRIAVRQGGEILAQLPGTIIHSDGIVATCASRLCYLKSKDLKATIDVKVLDTKMTYEGVLLDADFCSKVAFIKIMSPEEQQVARFVKLDYHYPQSMAVAVGCTTDLCVFPHAEPWYCVGFTSSIANEIENEQTDARTSGRVIKAVLKDKGIVIGGPLVNSNGGVIGVIHYEDSFGIKATPIHDVLKCLELFKKQQATSHPKSVVFA